MGGSKLARLGDSLVMLLCLLMSVSVGIAADQIGADWWLLFGIFWMLGLRGKGS